MAREPIIVRDEQAREIVLDLIGKLDLSKPWSVDVKPYRKKRTLDQNALYWRWCAIIADEIGDDKDDVHEIMMRKFLTPRWRESLTGSQICIWSTRKLTTAEFSAYLDRIHAWAASFLGIALPLPEQLHEQR